MSDKVGVEVIAEPGLKQGPSRRRGINDMVDGSLAVGQATIPGTEAKPKIKRRSLLEQAAVGDIVVALMEDGAAGIVAMEQVTDATAGPGIKERWLDQGIISAKVGIEVWELREGGYYRRRRAGR